MIDLQLDNEKIKEDEKEDEKSEAQGSNCCVMDLDISLDDIEKENNNNNKNNKNDNIIEEKDDNNNSLNRSFDNIPNLSNFFTFKDNIENLLDSRDLVENIQEDLSRFARSKSVAFSFEPVKKNPKPKPKLMTINENEKVSPLLLDDNNLNNSNKNLPAKKAILRNKSNKNEKNKNNKSNNKICKGSKNNNSSHDKFWRKYIVKQKNKIKLVSIDDENDDDDGEDFGNKDYFNRVGALSHGNLSTVNIDRGLFFLGVLESAAEERKGRKTIGLGNNK